MGWFGSSLMPGESMGMPDGTGGMPSSVNGLLNNPALQLGLGILANNQGNYGSFGAAIGKGGLTGLSNLQRQQEALRQQKLMDLHAQQIRAQKDEYQRKIQQENDARDAYGRLFQGQGAYITQQDVPFTRTENVPQAPFPDAQAPNFNTIPQTVTGVNQAPQFNSSLYNKDLVNTGIAQDIVKRQFTPREPLKLGKDDRLFDPSNYKELVGAAPDKVDWNKPFLPDGTPNLAYQDYSMRNSKAGASNNNIINNVSAKTGEGLAKEVGPMIAASKAAAEGANQTFGIANRIDNAISSKKLIAGPLANQRVQLLQAGQVLGLNGKDDTETLSNTRDAIQGLAQFTLAGRSSLKGQGQISDYEGKLLGKATSGDITDLTIPELKVISDAAKRVAKAQQDTHSRNMQIMRNKPELSGVADFYDVPTYEQHNSNVLPKDSTIQKPRSKAEILKQYGVR